MIVALNVDLSPGTLIAHTYEVLKPLGRGGMGELFVARNVRTERHVALKLLRSDVKKRNDSVERFRREARAAGLIRCEHVTQVLDVQDDSAHGIVIAFELLEGESLLDCLRRTGPMDFKAMFPVVQQIFYGLIAAHKAGIVHRDLKPSNVFLERRADGSTRVKILDFGISKLPKTFAQTTLTEPGQSLGSFMFMPPEQIQRAASVDARADIYALGTLVFQSMTGHLPYATVNLAELLRLKLSQPPLTLSAVSKKPFAAPLEAWVRRTLMREPKQRFQSAEEALFAWTQLAALLPSSEAVPANTPILVPAITDGHVKGPGPSSLPSRQPVATSFVANPTRHAPRWLITLVIVVVLAALGVIAAIAYTLWI